MTGFEAYKLFMGLNNHFFSANYDYFKYGGKVNVKVETYNAKRSDEKNRYDRLAKKFATKEELENFIVANLLEAKKRAWVGSLFGGDADNVYLHWQGRVQSLAYNITNEIKLLLEDQESFNNLFKCVDHEHPEILKAHMRGDVSLETFVVLDICLNFIPKLDEKLGDDRNWMLVKNKSRKYRPFIERLNIDVGNLSKVIKRAVCDMGVTS
jgi:T4 gene Gp59 loader of gp41 DNA helicase/T4 gene Gp59 loader of gp41 DNA helicase C-term